MNNRFHTTPWSLILAAKTDESKESQEALAELCQMYWYPLYAYVRRRGHTREVAEDITQGFFTQMIEREFLQFVDRTRGRFRSYLLTSLKHHMANDWHRKQAVKRGGAAFHVSLDADGAEALYGASTDGPATPEALFDRDWARTVLASALTDVSEDYAHRGEAALFDALKPYMTGDEDGTPYSQVAERLGMSEPAVKTAVHRLRRRLGQAIHARIAETLADAGQIEEEMKYLLQIL